MMGQELKDLCKREKVTQAWLADRLGVSHRHLRRMIEGKTPIRKVYIYAIRYILQRRW